MNILHATPHLTLRGGGLAAAVLGLAEAQGRLRHRVLIQSTEPCPPSSNPGALFEVLNCGHVGPTGISFSPAAQRWVVSPAAGKFDILHQHGIWSLLSRVNTSWRAVHNKPSIVAPHGSLEPWALARSHWKKRMALHAYERDNLLAATCLHATSFEEVASFRGFGLKNPVAVIPNGIRDDWMNMTGDPEMFRTRYSVAAPTRILLYLSRIHPKKGLLDLITAFAGIRDAMRGWAIVVAGPVEDMVYMARVTRAIDRSGLRSRIRFVGALDTTSKRDALAAADIMILPTHSDNFGIVVAEALAAGVPVVTTQGAIAWGILRDAKCGWWIPNGVGQLADVLRQVAALPAEALKEMGARGPAVVRARFMWTDAADRSIAVYRWAVGESARPDCVVT